MSRPSGILKDVSGGTSGKPSDSRQTSRGGSRASDGGNVRSSTNARSSSKDREFTKGGLVKGGLAIRHVFNLHTENGT